MKNIKRKGFTLVELLIVIVVIGILSAMMMLSSTEAVTSARASNIVSNLRNFKTAALAMYVDYLDKMEQGIPPEGTTASDWPANTAATYNTDDAMHKVLVKYMNKGDSNTGDTEINRYHLVKGKMQQKSGSTTKEVDAYFICYNNVNDNRVAEKLAGRAKSVGLLKEAKTVTSDSTTTNEYLSTSGAQVYMFVTQFTPNATTPATGS